jgi:hypothetical protein
MMKNRLNNDFRAFLNAGRTDIRAIFRLRPYRVSIYSDRVPECQPKQRVCRRPLIEQLLAVARDASTSGASGGERSESRTGGVANRLEKQWRHRWKRALICKLNFNYIWNVVTNILTS